MCPAVSHEGTTLTPSEFPAAPKSLSMLSMVVHTCKSSTWETEARGSALSSRLSSQFQDSQSGTERPNALVIVSIAFNARRMQEGSRLCEVQEAMPVGWEALLRLSFMSIGTGW